MVPEGHHEIVINHFSFIGNVFHRFFTKNDSSRDQRDSWIWVNIVYMYIFWYIIGTFRKFSRFLCTFGFYACPGYNAPITHGSVGIFPYSRHEPCQREIAFLIMLYSIRLFPSCRSSSSALHVSSSSSSIHDVKCKDEGWYNAQLPLLRCCSSQIGCTDVSGMGARLRYRD